MGDQENDPQPRRANRRTDRRDRTKSPHRRLVTDNEDGGNKNNSEEPGSMPDSSTRRKSALGNFSASKLFEALKETNTTTVTRLRRANTSDGTEASASAAPIRTRRPIARTMSAQAHRTPRRLRSTENDVLSQSLYDDYGDDNSNRSNDIDASSVSTSQKGSRRRTPQRTRSAQDSCLPRGHPGATQRTPRARRRPTGSSSSSVAEREEAAEELNGVQPRRRPPTRSKSADTINPPRGTVRTARPGRRRPQANDNDDDQEEEVIISDSDEEHNTNTYTPTDRSSRRRAPTRTRSSHEVGPHPRGGNQRIARAARRRPTGDSADGSPRRSAGPGFQRSLTATPPSSGSGPGLMRSHTSTNTRSARSRGGRNTAQEIAQVVAGASNREISPDPSEIEPPQQQQGTSPIKSRQERRRLREGKEREVLQRRMSIEEEPNVGPDKKEEPWMRRLKKNVVEKSNDDSFSFDDAAAARQDALTNHDSKGSSLPRLDEGNTFFAVDPTFGVFAPRPAVSDMPLSTLDSDALNDDDGTASVSIMDKGGENKLDFSTIS